MSQCDVLRRGTLAGGSPMRRIRILLLCILLFAKKFFDTLTGKKCLVTRFLNYPTMPLRSTPSVKCRCITT